MKKLLVIALIIITICSCFCLTAFAEGEEPAGDYKSVFDLAAEFVTENCAEILSLLTFVGSVIIAFTYKKGLLPRLSGALKGIGGSVGTLKENTERSIEAISSKMDEIHKGSESTELICKMLGDKLSLLAEGLDEIKGEKKEREAMHMILEAQVDMLYDIFMTSALPQYSKDAVFERINAMKSTLSEVGEADA